MNIEESINKIKEVIYMSDGTKVDYIDINHMDLGGEVSVDVFIRAIETLLTAYEKEKEKNKELNKYIEDRAKIGKNIQTFINKDYVEQEYISKDKIKEILEIEEKIDNEKLLSLLQTIVDENARLEDIEDRKVQIEYNNVFNKGVKSVEDKIKAKIEEVKDGTYDAKIVLQSLLQKE